MSGCDLRPACRAAMDRLRASLARTDDRTLAVHGARRAIKELRALLRPLGQDAKALDAELKTLASDLAPARDQRVAARTALALAKTVREARAAALLRDLAAEQDATAAELERRSHAHPRLARLARQIDALDLSVSTGNLGPSLSKAMRKAGKVYGRAGRAMTRRRCTMHGRSSCASNSRSSR